MSIWLQWVFVKGLDDTAIFHEFGSEEELVIIKRMSSLSFSVENFFKDLM